MLRPSASIVIPSLQGVKLPFASHALCPIQAQYLHTFRELRLSDHAPLEALFEPTSRQDT